MRSGESNHEKIMAINKLPGAGLSILAVFVFALNGFDKNQFAAGGEHSCLSFSAFADSAVKVRLGVSKDGNATDEWLAAIKDRMPASDWERIKENKKPLSEAERKWLQLAENTVRAWSARRGNLQIPFGRTKVPENLVILAGNQGGDDGFTFLENIICLELSALAANYGDAESEENRERLFRILDHEYTHLLHHEWFRHNPPDLRTPFTRALRDLLAEGIGNYRSLSGKWIDKRGTLTPPAKAALKELEPVFVERLTKLRRAGEREEEALRQNLSRGAFNKKWGALTVALWLAQETKGDDRKLTKWIKRGPKGVIKLAGKYLPAELKTKFLK
jgi:hypothetical protein